MLYLNHPLTKYDCQTLHVLLCESLWFGRSSVKDKKTHPEIILIWKKKKKRMGEQVERYGLGDTKVRDYK